MSRRERRMLFVLGLVLVVSIPFLPIWGEDGSSASIGGGEPGANRTAESRAVTEEDVPEFRADLLSLQPGRFSGTKRNLFAFGSSRQESTSSEEIEQLEDSIDDLPDDPEMEEAVERPARTQAAGQKFKDYKLSGLVLKESEYYAVFLWQDKQHFTGKTGDTVNKAFTIEEIGNDFVKVRAVKGNYQQRFSLPAPAGDEKAGKGDKK